MVVRLPLLGVHPRIPSSLAATATGRPVEMMQSAISRLYVSVYSGEPIQDPFVHARDAIRFRHAMESHPCVSEKTIQVIQQFKILGDGRCSWLKQSGSCTNFRDRIQARRISMDSDSLRIRP